MKSSDELGKSVTKLALGRVASVVTALVTAPILARLYDPVHFGVLALLASVAGILSVFAGLGYGQAIPMSTNRGEARALIRLCLVTTAVLMAPFVMLAATAGKSLADLLGLQSTRFIWFIPVIFLLSSITGIINYALAREHKFGTVAVSTFANDNVARVAQIFLAWTVGASTVGLVLGQIIGALVGLLIGGFVTVKSLDRRSTDLVSPHYALRDVAKSYSQFPKVQLWNNALNKVSVSLPVVIIGALFGLVPAGYYSFSRRLLVLPMVVLSSSMGHVFYPEAAREWQETHAMRDTITKTVRILSRTGVFFLTAVALLGPFLYSIIFSEKWREAGVYAQIITPWLLLVFVTSPVSTAFLVARREKSLLAYNVLLVLARSAALLFGSWVAGPRLALLLFSGVSLIIWIHQLAYLLKLGKANRRNTAALLLREGLSALLLLLPAFVAYRLMDLPFLSLGLAAAAAVGHCGLLLRREPALRASLLAYLNHLRRSPTQHDVRLDG